MSDGKSDEVYDHEQEIQYLGGFNTVGDHCAHETLPLMIEKWFRVGVGGIEFHGFDASEIIEILTTMSSMNPDAVRYRPES